MQSQFWQLFHRVLFVMLAIGIGQSWRSPQAAAETAPSQSSTRLTTSETDLPFDAESISTDAADLIPERSPNSALTFDMPLYADLETDAPEIPSEDHGIPDEPVPNPAIDASEEIADPELGVLRLRELPNRTFNILDPELGVLRLQEVPIPVEDDFPWLYWRTQVGFFWTDNLLSATEDLVQEGIYQARIGLNGYPKLNSRTFGIMSLEGSLTRYADEAAFDTQQFGLELGLYHTMTPRAYIQGGWRHEQYFARTDGDRFLSDHTLYFSLGRRDRLTSRLSLDTAYTAEYSLTDPTRRSQVSNRAYASLTYQITPELDTNLFYQIDITDFTRQDRNDFSQQLIGTLNYDFTSISQLSVYAGSRVGNSSESFIDFDSLFMGVSLSVNLPLF